MKKNYVQLVIIFLLSISFNFCNSKQEIPLLVNSNIQSLSSNFNKVSFNSQFGNDVVIDFSKSVEIEILHLGIPEKYIVTPVFQNNGNVFGNIYSLKGNDSTYRSLVVNTSNYNISNGYGTITYIGVGIDKSVSFGIEKYKIANMSTTDSLNSQIKSNSIESNLAPSCTGSCYKTAKDACDNDPDCKMLCDMLPTCNGSIVASCFLHCFFE